MNIGQSGADNEHRADLFSNNNNNKRKIEGNCIIFARLKLQKKSIKD
jgi:hypothetical protein